MKIDPLTKKEINSWPKEPLINLSSPCVDKRGSIQPLVDLMMKSAVMINSKAGSLRANHYHKTDWHYCYVISGQIEYFHRKLNSKKEHCMKFPVETLFLTLSRNPRDQETYEADVVRVNLVDDQDSISWKPDDK